MKQGRPHLAQHLTQRRFARPAACLLLLSLCFAPLVGAQNEGEAPADGEMAQEQAQNGAEPAVPEQPRYGSRTERDQQLLAQRFPRDARWLALPAPETETLALFRPAASAEPKGALLLLYGADNPPHWPAHLSNLRRALPRHGWATLALTLPLPEPAPVPERPAEPAVAENEDETEDDEENGENEENEDNDENEADEAEAPAEDPLPPRAERIANRLDAALNWLDQEGQGNLVVLVDDASAEAVMAHLQPQLEAGAEGEPPATGNSPLAGPIRALILVNAVPGQRLSPEALTQVFAVPEMPLLDVFLGPSSRLQERVRAHRDLAGRQRLVHYHSLGLPLPRVQDPDDERSFWVRRIHGFMLRQAEGMEQRRINQP